MAEFVNVKKVKEWTMEGYPGQYLKNVVTQADGIGFGLHWVRLTPGSVLPDHQHEGIELCYFLAGEGTAKMAGKRRKITADTAIVVPGGVTHSVKNTGKKTMKILALFVPALI